jgi:hypothetical protein
MESFAKKQGTYRDIFITKTEKKKGKSLNDIELEYGLKMNNFNPKNKSPNMFCNRLEKRMKQYYNNLYNSKSFI